MVIKWKNRYYNMKGLSQKVEQYRQKGPCLERLKGIVEFEILGLFARVCLPRHSHPRGLQ